MRLFLGSRASPLVLFFSNSRNCEEMQPSNDTTLRDKCTGCLQTHAEHPMCQDLPPEPCSPQSVAHLSKLARPYQSLAIHYNIPHLDMHELVWRSFMGEGASLHEQLGLTKWQVCGTHSPAWAMQNGSACALPSF